MNSIRMLTLLLVTMCLVVSSCVSYSQIQVTDLYEVGQGNVALTTTSLVIANQYIYSPDGVQRNLDRAMIRSPRPQALNVTQNQFGYTGQSLDPSTNLMMLGKFRNYAPGIDRFIQPDTYNAFTKTAILNPYGYVRGDPISAEDPTGHLSTGEIVGIAFGATALVGLGLGVSFGIYRYFMSDEVLASEVSITLLRIPLSDPAVDRELADLAEFKGAFPSNWNDFDFNVKFEDFSNDSYEGVKKLYDDTINITERLKRTTGNPFNKPILKEYTNYLRARVMSNMQKIADSAFWRQSEQITNEQLDALGEYHRFLGVQLRYPPNMSESLGKLFVQDESEYAKLNALHQNILENMWRKSQECLGIPNITVSRELTQVEIDDL